MNHFVEKYRLQYASTDNGVDKYVHMDYGFTVVRIAGHGFSYGISEHELVTAHELDADAIAKQLQFIQPAAQVELSDFLISQEPISDEVLEKCLSRSEDAGLYRYAYVPFDVAETCASLLGGHLPAEQQWEYCFRNGLQSLFPWGDSPDDDRLIAMHLGRNPDDSCEEILWQNRYGLQNMHEGEWCGDYVTHTVDFKTVNERVVRGGGALFWPWQNTEWIWAVCANRFPASHTFDGKVHFRVVYSI